MFQLAAPGPSTSSLHAVDRRPWLVTFPLSPLLQRARARDVVVDIGETLLEIDADPVLLDLGLPTMRGLGNHCRASRVADCAHHHSVLPRR